MLLRKQKKVNLDNFLSQRGINILDNYHLEENSIFLKKVLNLRRHKKTMSHNFFQSSIDSIPKESIYNSIKNIYISNPQSKKKLNYHSKVNSDTVSEYSDKNNIIESHNFRNNYLTKNKLFYSLVNKSNEDILNRFNRNKNYKMKKFKTNNTIFSKYMDSYNSFNTPDRQITIKNNRKIKKLLYTKKNKNSKFNSIYNNTPTNLSRNNLKYSHTQKNSNSKKNKISNIIDFSIIDKVNKRNNGIDKRILAKTSDNFYILNSRNQTKVNPCHFSIIEKKINKNKALKFFNHFIKYCYTYFILIIKKFFNNLKRIKNEKCKISNNNCSLFDEFNKDDFDKETIKNKTSDNFFEGLNDNSFSFTSEFKKNYIYNRQKRIYNQNFQEKNLIQILNMTKMDNTKFLNFENKRNCFDNEQINDSHNHNHINNYNSNNENNYIKNEVNHSPFFNSKIKPIKRKSENNNLLNNNNNSINLKNVECFDNKKKNRISSNKILIAPENMQNNQINDEILSFRKKNISENIIIQNYNLSTNDNKLSIDIKYMNDYCFKNSSCPYNNLDLKIIKFDFSLLSNLSNINRIKKITARLKDSKIVKEKEEILIKGYNNYNNNHLLYNLSTIKEEDERAKNESPFVQTFKAMEHYYPISNNSKLYSNASVEKIIDGDKEINEDDIDVILMDSLSGCKYNRVKKLKSWQSQEIMVVSNFNSIMRNRRNRKENAKLLIKGILCIIRFFSILCFNIRKDTYMELKLIWKINKFVNYLKIFCFKNHLKNAKILSNK